MNCRGPFNSSGSPPTFVCSCAVSVAGCRLSTGRFGSFSADAAGASLSVDVLSPDGAVAGGVFSAGGVEGGADDVSSSLVGRPRLSFGGPVQLLAQPAL